MHLIKKYPYLHGDAGDHADVSWKKKLGNYFRNTRKRSDRNVPEMRKKIELAAMRKKNKTQREAYHSAKVWGILNFKPDRLAGENDESIQLHHKTLNRESCKMPKARNSETIANCHNKLFPERREFILEPPTKLVNCASLLLKE